MRTATLRPTTRTRFTRYPVIPHSRVVIATCSSRNEQIHTLWTSSERLLRRRRNYNDGSSLLPPPCTNPNIRYMTSRSSLDSGFVEAIRGSFNLPNALTMSRILLTPGLAGLILTDRIDAAIVGCFFTGLLDFFDGYLARKWNQKTVAGAFLDPLADKLFIGTILAALTYQNMFPWQLTVLVVGRDVALLVGAFAYRAATKPRDEVFFQTQGSGVLNVEPTTLSKVNTVLQMSLLGFAMTKASPMLHWPTPEIFQGMCWVVAGTTIASGLSYATLSSLKVLRKG